MRLQTSSNPSPQFGVSYKRVFPLLASALAGGGFAWLGGGPLGTFGAASTGYLLANRMLTTPSPRDSFHKKPAPNDSTLSN